MWLRDKLNLTLLRLIQTGLRFVSEFLDRSLNSLLPQWEKTSRPEVANRHQSTRLSQIFTRKSNFCVIYSPNIFPYLFRHIQVAFCCRCFVISVQDYTLVSASYHFYMMPSPGEIIADFVDIKQIFLVFFLGSVIL